MKLGILALQGAVEPHAEKLRALEVEPVFVRTPAQLDGLSGIILPGGESTTMLHLLELNQLWNPLAGFIRERPVLGLCAGCILLAKEVTHPAQKSLEAIDIKVERNGFGRQTDSFIDQVTPTPAWPGKEAVEGVFIRAPRIERVGPGVETLFTFRDEPVMVRRENILAATFHPELSTSSSIHRYFANLCQNATRTL